MISGTQGRYVQKLYLSICRRASPYPRSSGRRAPTQARHQGQRTALSTREQAPALPLCACNVVRESKKLEGWVN